METTSEMIVRPRKTARRAPAPAPVAEAAGDTPRPLVRRRDNPWLRRALVFATCVILADAVFGDRGLAETLRARRDYYQAIAALSAVQQENAALRDEARRLQGDPEAIESVAREDLGLIRPGEILVVVKDLR